MSDDDNVDVREREPNEASWAAAVTFATTEHFTLQTARGATIAETNGRATLFLGTVSAGLVAFAFAGQTSLTALYVFGLVLFPVLFFLGLTTFRRALQASIADTLYILRINRLRRFYVDRAPQLAAYMAPPEPTDNLSRLLREEGYQPSRWQTFLSIPAAIGVVNGALLGATVGLAVAALTSDNLWFGTITALVTFVVSVTIHQRYETRARTSKPDPFAVDD
jgi:hypothetical protein